MGNLYGHRLTSANGILKYIQLKYPNSNVIKELNNSKSSQPINDFLKKYRKETEPLKPFSKCIHKNSEYIQNNFSKFISYLKENEGKF